MQTHDLARASSSLQHSPHNPDAWVQMGRALAARGVRDEPAACYRQALFFAADHADALIALGLTLLRTSEIREAGRCFAQVLATNTNHPEALGGIAMVLERQGDLAGAWTFLQASRHDVPIIALAAASVGPRIGKIRPALRRVTRALEAFPNTLALRFAHAELLHRLRKYPEAFQAYSLANHQQGGTFDAESHLRSIDAHIASMDRYDTSIQPDPGAGRPVFIVGMPRSGTSLVEQILSCHPDVHANGELEALRDIAVSFGGYPLTELSHDTLVDGRNRYLAAIGPHGSRATDKMPNNVLHLGLAARLTPEARVIHVVRDARDAGMSCFRQPFGSGLPWANSIAGIAAWSTGVQRLITHYEQTLPLPIHTVRYEDLVSAPGSTIPALLDSLELPFDTACLQPHEHSRIVATQSHAAVTEPMHTRAIGNSEPYAKWLDGHFQPTR
jgi:tetratricopeptide (TPR) repeat protein